MQEKRKKVILSSRQELLAEDFVEHAERDGIELEKGAVITNEYLADGEENIVIPPIGRITWNGIFHYPPA